jgi:hypothetical protein
VRPCLPPQWGGHTSKSTVTPVLGTSASIMGSELPSYGAPAPTLREDEMAGRLFTYVITHDGGFAPNPFHGVLTLNCCKPDIRRTAQEGA